MEQFLSSDYCLRCRGCCYFPEEFSVWSPYVTNAESAALPKGPAGEACVTAAHSIRLVPDRGEFRCIFLDPESHACAIYPSRPLECRIYPFLLAAREGKIFLAIDTYCPYVKEQMGTEHMKLYIERLVAFLNDPRQKSLVLSNPHLIHPYEEVVYLTELYGDFVPAR
jgi:Fe-S-cluster containining protein